MPAAFTPQPSEGVRAGRRALTPVQRADYVRRMFSAIAPRYDLTNTVISAGLHRVWKRLTIETLRLQTGETALDVCCGTGDLVSGLARRVGKSGYVVGVDFAAPMVDEARRQSGTLPADSAAPRFAVADAMALPFSGGTFDAATIGFGLRNVADPEHVLGEIHRVLKPGGRLAVLEFARVRNPLLRGLYDLYSFTLLAGLGRVFSGHRDAYTYLPVSARHWLDQAATLELLGRTGLHHARCRNLAGGVVAIYTAEADRGVRTGTPTGKHQ